MTEVDRELVEARLKERAEEIARARERIHREGEGMLENELSHLDNHPADEGTETFDRELDETATVFLEEEERRVEEARRRLAQGKYGICVVCGKPIPPERLNAMPEAIRCVEDQRLFEAQH